MRDGAARGRRPLLRRAADEGVRLRLGARPAGSRAPHRVPPRLARGVPSAAERRQRARRVQPHRAGGRRAGGEARRRGSVLAPPQDAPRTPWRSPALRAASGRSRRSPSSVARRRCAPRSSSRASSSRSPGPSRDRAGAREDQPGARRAWAARAPTGGTSSSPSTSVSMSATASPSSPRRARRSRASPRTRSCAPRSPPSAARPGGGCRSRRTSPSQPVSAAAAPTPRPRSGSRTRSSRRPLPPQGLSTSSQRRPRRGRAVLSRRRAAARRGRRDRARGARPVAVVAPCCSSCRTARASRSTADVYAAFDRASGEAGFEERAGALREALAGLGRRPRDLARLPPNDLASSPHTAALLAEGAIPRRRERRRADALRPLREPGRGGPARGRRLGRLGRVWVAFPAWYG